MRASESIQEAVQPTPRILKGVIHSQYVRCGNSQCRCRSGQMHGPYHYLIWRGPMRVHKVYIRPDEVESVQAACEAYTRYQKRLKEIRSERERLAKAIARQCRSAFRRM